MRSALFVLALSTLAACDTSGAPDFSAITADDAASARAPTMRDLAELQAQMRALGLELRDTRARLVEAEIQLGVRDPASGQATGRRMYERLAIVEETVHGVVGDTIRDDVNAIYDIVSPRDAASGLPTGKRSLWIEIDELQGVVSPRDPASGLPTGKTLRDEVDGLSEEIGSIRTTMVSSGDRVTIDSWSFGTSNPSSWQYLEGSSSLIEADVDGDGMWETLGMTVPGENGTVNAYTLSVRSPRDAASGMATGRR